ncbi:MAG: hypothetical protein U0176_19495 [Bacteroidia bacterium]
MTAYVFRISLECPHCRTGVPVNAFTQEVLCNNCLRSIELDHNWWAKILDRETIEEAMDYEPGHGNSAQHLGGMNETVETGNRPPRCQDCKTDFPVPLMTNSAEKGGFSCPGCQKPIRVRMAPGWVKSIVPEAHLLVHEDADGKGLGSDGHSAVEPVLFACLSCGAGLPVDGSTRMPKCTHCGNSNYLPDPLWLRLHPAAVSHAFFVTLPPDLKPKPVTADSLKDDLDEDKALRILKDQALEPAVLRRMYEIFADQREDDVFEALAKHPNTPDDVLAKLCNSDNDDSVQVAIANRPTLGAGAYLGVSSSESRDVKLAVMARKDFWNQPETIQKRVIKGLTLFHVQDYVRRQDFPEWALLEVAKNASTSEALKIMQAPNVSVRVLKILASNEQTRPLIKEHRLYKELNWFNRLFFFAGT